MEEKNLEMNKAVELEEQKNPMELNERELQAVQTLAARGVSGFTGMFKVYEEKSPLQRSCTLEELGATATYLASDGAASVTGQVIYVDGGYEIVGM